MDEIFDVIGYTGFKWWISCDVFLITVLMMLVWGNQSMAILTYMIQEYED